MEIIRTIIYKENFPNKNIDMDTTFITQSKPAIQQSEQFRGNWLCQSCGSIVGRVFKKNRMTIMRPVNAPEFIISGDAKIPCPNCDSICQWFWNEYELKRIINFRLKGFR